MTRNMLRDLIKSIQTAFLTNASVNSYTKDKTPDNLCSGLALSGCQVPTKADLSLPPPQLER